MQTAQRAVPFPPMYYKVLAETRRRSYIAYAPAHVFIRYRNEIRLSEEGERGATTHQITPEFFYKEHFEISDKAIENKIYLTSTDREAVAATCRPRVRILEQIQMLRRIHPMYCGEIAEYYPQHPKACIIWASRSMRPL